jgi:hypothetical protein
VAEYLSLSPEREKADQEIEASIRIQHKPREDEEEKEVRSAIEEEEVTGKIKLFDKIEIKVSP